MKQSAYVLNGFLQRKSILFMVFMFLGMIFNLEAQTDKWQQLFNGRDLSGWIQRGGNAPYTIKDGAIVGTTVADAPNSFLCTERNFGDFILELELMVDTSMNSGIQFRSLSTESYQQGRVHGYQMEVDPSKRAWSGGIYDEAARGWLYTMEINPRGKNAFKNNQWNTYRIEAIGNHIRTWVNGIPTADIFDAAVPSGFIALQVHAVDGGKPWTLGTEVKWKNIRILTDHPEAAQLRDKSDIPQLNYVPNTLTDSEKQEGWSLLFDGLTSNGWRGAYKDKFPDHGWEIKDGILSVLPSEGKESTNGGDIVTMDQYSNFELSFEFRITEGANSGVKYFVTEKENNQGSAIGLEYQILDDVRHPDAKLGRDGNRTLGSLYDLIPAGPKRPNPIGQWNNGKIVCKGNHVEHWLNGFKIVSYERGSQAFRDLVAISKYKVWPGFGEAPQGHILLQDHGNLVSYRSIKIRKL